MPFNNPSGASGGGGGGGDASAANQTTGNASLSSIDGKTTTSNTSLSSIDGKLTTGDASLASIDGKLTAVALASAAYTSTVTLTRTADTTTYAINDVMGSATNATSALTFANAGPSGKDIIIKSIELMIFSASLPAGMANMRLHLYNVTPPSAYFDNVGWDILTGDRASYLGFLDFGSPVDLGGTLYVRVEDVDAMVKLSGTSLFGYLVTTAGYTPVSATVHQLTIHSVAL